VVVVVGSDDVASDELPESALVCAEGSLHEADVSKRIENVALLRFKASMRTEHTLLRGRRQIRLGALFPADGRRRRCDDDEVRHACVVVAHTHEFSDQARSR
jgi:hypothetical protein